MLKNFKKHIIKFTTMATHPPSDITEGTRLKLPAAIWFSLLAFAFGFGGAWTSYSSDVKSQKEENKQEIINRTAADEAIKVDLKESQKEFKQLLTEMQNEQKKQGELLIRIDERVKLLGK